MNLAQLDLNLLVVLDAVLHERSVTRAAKLVRKSQPAVSNALARLRETLGDPLLVRSGGTMALTPRAREIAPLVRDALAAVERAMAPPLAFQPATAKQTFTFAATDYMEMVLLPPVVARVAALAPGVTLDVRPIGETSPLDGVQDGTFDGALGVFMSLPPGFRKKVLAKERFQCVVRAGHPALRKGALTLEAFAKLSHVLAAPRRSGPAAVDNLLAERGLSRHIALVVSHFLVVPLVVAETNLVATLPARAAKLLAERLDLAVFDPPFPSGGFEIAHVWHERTQTSAPHAWLRKTIAGALSEAEPKARGAARPASIALIASL